MTKNLKCFAINGESAVLYLLPYAMVNTECAEWFYRHPELNADEIQGSRQVEIAGKWYMGINCETTVRVRQLVAREVGAIAGITDGGCTVYDKAFVEGEDRGMSMGSYWDGTIARKPTDTVVEHLAELVLNAKGLRFENDFDGRTAFLDGFWQGWRKAITPRERTRTENAHAESMALGG